MTIARLRWLAIGFGCASGLAGSVVTLRLGAWSEFAASIGRLPDAWRHMAAWAYPMLAVYGAILLGGIFLGLRRIRKGAL